MASPITQGTLNRLRCHIVLPSFSGLNIAPQNMGKSFASVTFDGDFSLLIPTATGAVPSPEPFVEATITVGILRTQALASSWKTQWETLTTLGDISIFPDTTAFTEFDLSTCVIQHFNPNAYDGNDPVSQLMLKGVYYINSSMWSAT